MTDDKTIQVLRSAARWLQRRAKNKSGADTRGAYRKAIVLVNGLTAKKVKRVVAVSRTTPDAQ